MVNVHCIDDFLTSYIRQQIVLYSTCVCLMNSKFIKHKSVLGVGSCLTTQKKPLTQKRFKIEKIFNPETVTKNVLNIFKHIQLGYLYFPG